MSQSRRPRDAGGEQGFSLLEVIVAIVVLTIGLMSTAALMANVYKYTVRSRYMALASQLASEELEDLSRWPVPVTTNSTFTDPHIDVPSGSNTCGLTGETCIGSLTADYGPQTFTDSSGANTYVSYFDTVSLATQDGRMSETYKMPCTGPPDGTGDYVTVTYSPDGTTPNSTANPAPCTASAPIGTMTFGRRWVIEKDQPVAGVRRITVLITLKDLTINPPVTFQMSMVRP